MLRLSWGCDNICNTWDTLILHHITPGDSAGADVVCDKEGGRCSGQVPGGKLTDQD